MSRIHIHVCTKILQLEDDDIKAIKKYSYGRDNYVIKPNTNDIEQLRDNDNTFPGLCKELL